MPRRSRMRKQKSLVVMIDDKPYMKVRSEKESRELLDKLRKNKLKVRLM